MKYTLFLFALCFFVSCKKEKDIVESIQISGAHLDTKVLRDYLPQAYQQNKKVVYVNQNADTLVLNTYWRNVLNNRVEGTETYTSDDFTVTLYSPDLPTFSIVVTGSANFSQNKVVRFIDALYHSDEVSPVTASAVIGEDGLPVKDVFSSATFLETLTLNGKTFKNCFKTPFAYSNVELKAILYLNSDEGVPAFVDKNGNTYVFHGFVD